MLLWILCALLTAGVVWALVRPLRAGQSARDDAAPVAETRVYRDQLSEIDADLDRGLITPAEAEAARLEVSRRLLAASAARQAEPAAARVLSPRQIAAGLALGVPLAALVIYLVVGAPGIVGEPLADRDRVAAEVRQVNTLVAQVEARLVENPQDGQGWDVIAPVYMRLERWEDAAKAFRRAYELRGETPARLAGFAAATIEANGGNVVEPARIALEKVLTLDPKSIEARFWLAIAKEQAGDRTGAANAYRALIDSAPPGAPWRLAVEQRLAAVVAPSARPAPGPASDPEAAAGIASLSPADRAKAIAGMVEGLAQRLKTEGGDVAGWQRLIRAYTVMGEGGKARAALADARKALSGNAAALAALDGTARELGLGG